MGSSREKPSQIKERIHSLDAISGRGASHTLAKCIGVPLTLLFASLAVTLAGCAGSPSPLAPASLNAQIIYSLSVAIFWIAVVVFVVVEGMLLFSVVRYSRRAVAGEPRQIEGNPTLEIAWTAAPAIVLLIVFFFSVQALMPLASQPSTLTKPGAASGAPNLDAGSALNVRVVGHQWWWEFDYPDYKVITASEMHIPVGTRVDISVESVDVIHSFWVPQLGGKIDVIPGHINHTWILADEAGRFHGQCAEFCGIEHANMRFEVVAESKDQFQAWLQAQQAPVAAKTGDAAKGEQIFIASACIGCHTIEGTKAQGKVGPNLTHFATRRTFAGAILENTPENVGRWLSDPPAIKPGTLMPNLHLTQDQIDALVAYLESLK